MSGLILLRLLQGYTNVDAVTSELLPKQQV